MDTLQCEKHLTQFEKELFHEIKKNPLNYTDTIIDHGYSGVISVDNIDSILGTVMVSIVSRRNTYLSELSKGMNLFEMFPTLKNHKTVFKEVFVTRNTDVDANYIMSILNPIFSSEPDKRKVEESVIDHLQDFLNYIEDNHVAGHSGEMTTYNEGIDDYDSADDDSKSNIIDADLTPAGVLGWLTGQRHKPVFDKDSFQISVTFNHDCKVGNPRHTICFPVVRACSRDLDLPIQHMKSFDDFKSNFLLAFSKGQSFGMS